MNRNWNDTDESILPLYRELIAHGVRVWVFRLVFKQKICVNVSVSVSESELIMFDICCKFSGDVDSVVPVTATRFSLAELRLTTKIPWYPWYVKKQVCFLINKNILLTIKC